MALWDPTTNCRRSRKAYPVIAGAIGVTMAEPEPGQGTSRAGVSAGALVVRGHPHYTRIHLTRIGHLRLTSHPL
jgi:hypothetical protein